jgi:hypothetical protein
MSGPIPENERVLLGVARVLGLPDRASLAALQPSGLWKTTQRDLLEIARLLGLSGVSRLTKQALLARIWEALERLGAIPPDGVSEMTLPASKESPARRIRPAAMAPADVSPSAALPAASLIRDTRARSQGNNQIRNQIHDQDGNQDRSNVADPIPVPSLQPERRPERQPEPEPETPGAAAHKFDVGQTPDRDAARARAQAEAHIPWGYGRDRVTAMPVDPDRLFVQWEVTDDALSRARSGLGAGGPGAWLSLRVYDVTGRLFDGTNAHSYFDHAIERGGRQWFFELGKPSSQVVVDIGMKSHEGYFAKITRSGRVDFPRREPVPWSEPEWMTVRVSTGEIGGISSATAGSSPATRSAPGTGEVKASVQEPAAMAGGWESFGQDVIAGVRRRLWQGRVLVNGLVTHERQTWEEGGLYELDTEVSYGWSWEGDREVASWTAGPFSYPVELPTLVRESYAGAARTFRNNGRTHVVWGPWQIVIRGLGAQAEQSVIARWELYRSWTTSGWRESSQQPAGQARGSSELLRGGSERWGRGGSELRLVGASERFVLGASELRFQGASEWLLAGASERLRSGASEWRFMGASEQLLQGASERLLPGASERRLGGASDQLGGQPDTLHGSTWPSPSWPQSSSKRD